MAHEILTSARLRELLHYEPLTGVLTRRTDMFMPHGGMKIRAGSMVGTVRTDGYISVGVDGKQYLAHRLAWLYMTGSWPAEHIDHRDGSKSNNAWGNLREASRSLNMQNMRLPTIHNKTGFLGVSWHKECEKYCAYIEIDGRTKYLGLFPTAELASDAYIAEKRRSHPGNTL